MLDAARSFLDRRTTLLTRTLATAAVIAWGAGELIPALGDWIRNQGLSTTIAVALIAETLNRVSELRPRVGRRELAVYADQNAGMPNLIGAAHQSAPKSADFILHSGWTMGDLLRELAENKKTCIRVLIQHPDEARNQFERDQIEACITYLLGVSFAHSPRAKLYLYRSPAAVRGCLMTGGVSGMIAVSWYRYDKRGDEVVQGHVNPLIVAPLSAQDGRTLAKMFRAAFDALLSADDTEEATDGPRGRSALARRLLESLKSAFPSRSHVRGHEKVPTGGRRKVPTGGHVEVPTLG